MKPIHIFVRIFLLLLLLAFFFLASSGCTICRHAAIKDADKYTDQGYETRIVVYDLSLDGLLWGAFIWDHHAQAQVKKDGHWYWVCELGGLCEEPTFTIKSIMYYWEVQEFKDLLAKHGK